MRRVCPENNDSDLIQVFKLKCGQFVYKISAFLTNAWFLNSPLILVRDD